jgi:hypothetical protein
LAILKTRKSPGEFLYFIGVDANESGSDEQVIKTLLYMDEKQTPFLTDIPLSGDGITVLNAALALHFIGMNNNADNLARIGIKLLMEGFLVMRYLLRNLMK